MKFVCFLKDLGLSYQAQSCCSSLSWDNSEIHQCALRWRKGSAWCSLVLVGARCKDPWVVVAGVRRRREKLKCRRRGKRRRSGRGRNNGLINATAGGASLSNGSLDFGSRWLGCVTGRFKLCKRRFFTAPKALTGICWLVTSIGWLPSWWILSLTGNK